MANLRLVLIKPQNGLYGFTFDQTDTGVRATQVTSVLPSGAAAQAGLEPGQLIVSIGDTPVHGLTVHQVQSLIDETTSRFGEVALYVSSRDQSNRLSRPGEIPTRTTFHDTDDGTDFHSRFDSNQRSVIPDRAVATRPFTDHAFTQPDPTSAEINLRVVRKEAYRSAPDGSSVLAGRSLSPGSTPSDQHQCHHPRDPLPTTCSSSPTPQISYKPRHTNVRTTARFTSPSGTYGSHQPQLGAVASLAIDGGLSPDQLLHIGCAGTEPTSRSPPEPVEESGTISPVRAIGPSAPRHMRPTYATHHQPVLLSRTLQTGAGGSTAFRAPSRAHIRIPSWSSSRGYHHPFHLTSTTMATVYSGGTRRGSFPLQMTRVGGLVLAPRDGTQALNNQTEHDLDPSGTYQCLSACTSPTSVKHLSESSSSPRGGCTTAFFSSSVPSPANTPPLPPVTNVVSATAPTSCVDIVRLGPGDTVTHALPGDSHYNAHSLIRMHYCPQPYVSPCPMPDDTSGSRASVAPSSGTPPWFTCETGSPAADTQTFSPLSSSAAPVVSQAIGTTLLQHSSSTSYTNMPGDQATVIPDSRLVTPDSSVNPQPPTSHSLLLHATPVVVRPSGLTSQTGPQVARTVRHLRRIRHIFGDSLGYTSSVTSASMGALAAAENSCTCTNSLVELRPHGSRSVESVRPASLVCNSPEPECGLEAELAANRCTEALFSSPLIPGTNASTAGPTGVTQPSPVLVRFDQLPAQYQNCKCPTVWERYCASLVDDTLRLTRLVPPGQVDECTRPPAQLHLPLAESSLTWHSPSDLSELGLPSGARCTQATGDHDHCSVLGFLRIPANRIQCQLFFPHRSCASLLLGQWGPTASAATVICCESGLVGATAALTATASTTTQTLSESSTAQSQQQPSSACRQSARGKHATGRSSSLGLAGPPGGVPLFRAMGTAAASVGMPLVGRSSLSSWFHSGSQKVVAVATGEPVADPVNGEVTKEVTGNASAPASSTKGVKKPVTSTVQTRSSRGRFHQAFTRMRRAATASSAPTARSPSRNTGARRFASSHGALMTGKSSVSTASVRTGSPPTGPDQLGELSSTRPDTATVTVSSSSSSTYLQAAHDPVARSSPALLLATSVSPSPALLSPYLTYFPSETSASAEDRLYVDTNNLDVPAANEFLSSESSSEPPGHPIGTEDSARAPLRMRRVGSSELVAASCTVPTGATSVSVTGPSDVVLPLMAPPAAPPPRTVSAPHPFIPLPVPRSGPLALHKCPRSTLSPFVPFIVEFCVTLVERYGLNCVGLYRLSGSKVAHDFISTELRKNLNEIDVTSDKWNDIHAICGVLKTFLRNLPDSLFPKVMYPDFLSACRVAQREKRLLSIQRLLSIMECYPDHPEYRAHRATLRYLATHLARVSAREAVNKMTAYNLALVFAPNLVQPCEDSPELLMSDSKYKIMLVETVIKYHAWIFSPDLGLESGCSVPTDSNEELPATTGPSGSQSAEMPTEMSGRSATEPGTGGGLNSLDSEDPTNQPGRLEGDVQPLVAELLSAAASLPPPPSDTDLETAEEPGPASDRPSDIAVDMVRGQPVPTSAPGSASATATQARPRFTSIPTPAWSAAALRALADGAKFRPELILTQENATADMDDEPGHADKDAHLSTSCLSIVTVSATHATNVAVGSSSLITATAAPPSSGYIPRPRPFTAQLGTKLDSLRHLSQGCLDQYTTEARQLGVRVAESRRQLETTVAQRLHAEQLLSEARGQQTEFEFTPEPVPRTGTDLTGYGSSQRQSTSPKGGPRLPGAPEECGGDRSSSRYQRRAALTLCFPLINLVLQPQLTTLVRQIRCSLIHSV